MAEGIIATIRIDVTTGKIVGYGVQGYGGTVSEVKDPAQIQEARKRVLEAVSANKGTEIAKVYRTDTDVGCLYWDGQQWIKWC